MSNPTPDKLAIGTSNYYILASSETEATVRVVKRSTLEVIKTITISLADYSVSSITDLLVHEDDNTTYTLFMRRSDGILRYESSIGELTSSTSASYSMPLPYWFYCDGMDASNTLGSTRPDTINLALLEQVCDTNGLLFYDDFTYQFPAGAFWSASKAPWKSSFLQWASSRCSSDTYEPTCQHLRELPPYACATRADNTTIITTVYGNFQSLMAALSVALALILRQLSKDSRSRKAVGAARAHIARLFRTRGSETNQAGNGVVNPVLTDDNQADNRVVNPVQTGDRA